MPKPEKPWDGAKAALDRIEAATWRRWAPPPRGGDEELQRALEFLARDLERVLRLLSARTGRKVPR